MVLAAVANSRYAYRDAPAELQQDPEVLFAALMSGPDHVVGTVAIQKVMRSLGFTCYGNKDRLIQRALTVAEQLRYRLGGATGGAFFPRTDDQLNPARNPPHTLYP